MEFIEVVNTNELILLSVAGLLFLIQVIYYLALYNRIRTHNKAVRRNKLSFSEVLSPLSIVIYAKNETENLRSFLPSVLEQDYPEFEVIVVNDGPTDESEELLSLLSRDYPHLHRSFTPENSRYISHKKLALTLGIKASKYDWLVFTEANCHPVSKNWLRLMARNFTPGTDIVLGYSGYERMKGWMHKKIAFDTLFISMRYLGYALARKPYMGIGRNMAYRKELFFQQKGFSAHLNLQRGDDDLFVNKIATKKNTRVETDVNATIRMRPIQHKTNWREKKVSYMATSQYYRGSQRYVLGFETFTRILFYLAVIATIIFGTLDKHWQVAGIGGFLWLVRFMIQAIIINKTAKQVGESRRYYFSLPVFDILQPLQSLGFKIFRIFRGKRADIMTR
ncbi:MAG: glycosyltransferase [Mediterranea sp.]|jgi:glycosyltransferase involved in cell wall biosynthesis|nr:glycosyltransferase [Mediterranea sp.]